MGTRYQDEAVSELTAEAKAERYMAAGYRRISNTYRLVSRIDDPNWEKHRKIATLYQTGSSRASCEDYYRRVISKDKRARCRSKSSTGSPTQPARSPATAHP